MPLEMYRCKVCELSYPRTAEYFVANPICADGLEGRCKICRNIKVRDYKRANAAWLAETRRNEYAADNGAQVIQRECRRAIRDPFRVRAQRLRKGMSDRAIELGLPFDGTTLTVEYLERRLRDNSSCECCGQPMDIEFRAAGRNGPRVRSPSADRIIPKLGYVLANVAILCWRCNNLKRDARPEELAVVVAWMRFKERKESQVPEPERGFEAGVILAALSEAA
jgi:hypothetical protein